MDRRDLLKLSPLALVPTFGYVAMGETMKTGTVEAMYNVRSFGATGDGKTVDTPAVNKALEAVAAAGGGVLVFPAGTYLCFTIHLQSKVDLYLSPGCVIVAADSPRPGETTGYNGGTYDAAESNAPWEAYQDYGHNHWRNSLFYGEGLHDFAIMGTGMIWGRGLSNGSKGMRGGTGGFVAEQAGVGNKSIALKNCHNVLLRDFSVLKGGHFALLATGVDNLTIDNLVVDTDRDGFDIDCCKNVRVSNCTVNSPWDDAICPKSSYALGYARSTDNVTIADCFVAGNYELGSVIAGTWKKYGPNSGVWGNGRIKCGTESNGGFRNIAITNCVCEGSRGISLETSDGAYLEDVAITNITMRETLDAPLFLRLNKRNRGPKETMRTGTLRRVTISNVVSYRSESATCSIMSGVADELIEDVKLSNCYFGHKGEVPKGAIGRAVPELEDGYPELGRFGPTPANGFFVRHLKNLEMSHVEIAPEMPDARPAFWLEDVHRADFFAVTAPGEKNFVLKNVTDLRILWSRAAKDATVSDAEDEML
ncbi:MAG: glycoside hydrolase family 28 protein [Acidobacteria bacterium]|nr:glycoside hydrolase family 28 protein [Acidobacteriota bacterium]